MALTTMCSHHPTTFLVDLDGTLVAEGAPLPGACRFFELYADRLVVVSNNSTHTAEKLAHELAACNLPIAPARIVTAGESSLQLIRRRYPGARVLLAASEDIRYRAGELGIESVQQDADIVLLCRDRAFTYATLQRIVREMVSGARLVAANPDFSHPGKNGIPVPETGALLAAVESCSQIKAAHVVGKPGPDLYLEAMQRCNWQISHSVVIGDNETTDILGASRLGMRSFLIGPKAQIDSLTTLTRLFEQHEFNVSGANDHF
jgi:HAD superfamily hydrolase (TIGR01450 family)